MNALVDHLREQNKIKQYRKGLELNKTESAYLKRLIAHDWLYFLNDNSYQYREGQRVRDSLKKVADAKQGKYAILFDRVYNDRVPSPQTFDAEPAHVAN